MKKTLLFSFYIFITITAISILSAINADNNSAMRNNQREVVGKVINVDPQKEKREIIEKVIWCEARNSMLGVQHVISVIYNRAKQKNIEGYYRVVTAKDQFSCYDYNNKEIVEQKLNYADKMAYLKVKTEVNKLLSKSYRPINRATHYYAYKKIKKPYWAKKMKVVAREGGHIFLAYT